MIMDSILASTLFLFYSLIDLIFIDFFIADPMYFLLIV